MVRDLIYYVSTIEFFIKCKNIKILSKAFGLLFDVILVGSRMQG